MFRQSLTEPIIHTSFPVAGVCTAALQPNVYVGELEGECLHSSTQPSWDQCFNSSRQARGTTKLFALSAHYIPKRVAFLRGAVSTVTKCYESGTVLRKCVPLPLASRIHSKQR